jgi:hypothetical protein
MRRLVKKASYTRLIKLFEKDLYEYCKFLDTTQHELQYIIRDRMKFSTDDIQVCLFITDRKSGNDYKVKPKEILKELQNYAGYFSIKEVRIIAVNPLIEKSTFLTPNKSIEERIFYEYYPNRLSSRNFEMWRNNHF